MNDHGEIIIGICIFIFVVATLLGGFFMTKDLPCDSHVQHCINYPGGSFEAPLGQPREVTP